MAADTPTATPPTPRLPFYEEVQQQMHLAAATALENVPELEAVAVVLVWSTGDAPEIPFAQMIYRGESTPPDLLLRMQMATTRFLGNLVGRTADAVTQVLRWASQFTQTLDGGPDDQAQEVPQPDRSPDPAATDSGR